MFWRLSPTSGKHAQAEGALPDLVRALNCDLPARLFSHPGRLFLDFLVLQNRTGSAATTSSSTAFLARCANLDARDHSVVAQILTIGSYPAIEVRLDCAERSLAALMVLAAPAEDASRWASAQRARYLVVQGAPDLAGNVIEVFADATRRLLGVQATTATLRTCLDPNHVIGSARRSSDGSLIVGYTLDATPNFGECCICCGRTCASDSLRLKASKTLSAPIFGDTRDMPLPRCQRCRWSSLGRTIAILAAAGVSAGIGYHVCRQGFGWWPTGRAAQKLTLAGLAIPGAIASYCMWGDPDLPAKICQSKDRLEVTFEPDRVSSEFRSSNRAIFG